MILVHQKEEIIIVLNMSNKRFTIRLEHNDLIWVKPIQYHRTPRILTQI